MHTAQPPVALVVNDDPSQRRFAASILTKDGFKVVPCQSAEEALRVMEKGESVDVIITDLYMPDIDGWRFCQLLRSPEYAAFNTIPILVVSATFCGAEAEAVTVHLGANAFLAAPYDSNVLRARVRDLLAGRTPKVAARVLIVEDSQSQAKILRRAFEAHGYMVLHAPTGADGRRLYTEHQPEIVILDYHLPDTTGDQLLTEIKRPGSASVVIVITTNPTPTLALQFLRQGADGYARKPFVPEYLVELCENARRQKALLRVEEILEARTRELRESEERCRSLFENANDGIATFTLGGIITSVNRGLEVMLGRSREELIGRHYRMCVTPASLALAEERTRSTLAGEKPASIFEIELVRKDGSIVPVEGRTRAIRALGGKLVGFQGIYRDISSRRELERQRAEFLAMLTHDIKSPLEVILGCTQVLLEDVTELSLETGRDFLERIRSNTLAVHSLVANYLDFSKIEARHLTLTKSPLQLNDILLHVGQRYEPEAQRQRISLEFQLHKGLPLITGDPLGLERVFANLVHNALKFTEAGRVTIRSTVRRGGVVATITDTGPGIPPEDLPFLFQKYRRSSLTQHKQGTGLGLFIAKEVVEAHGGRIKVKSTLGQGSCFSVFLPAASAAPCLA